MKVNANSRFNNLFKKSKGTEKLKRTPLEQLQKCVAWSTTGVTPTMATGMAIADRTPIW
jgi:hypothetical protein